MITTLPDANIQAEQEIRRRLEPRNKLLFFWDRFFSARKFKLTAAEIEELKTAEAVSAPWDKIVNRLYDQIRDPNENLWVAIGKLKTDPTEENLREFLLCRSVFPQFYNQTRTALDELEGFTRKMRHEKVVPLVKRHLEKIHRSLVLEYDEQERSDRESLERLNGAITGGESEACIQLRNRAHDIEQMLASGDLSNWRACLAPFL